VWLSGRRLAAEWGTVDPDPGGGFTLVDHERGRTVPGLGLLVSEGDSGDAYTHQPEGSTPPVVAEFGPGRGVWNGPLVAAVARGFRVRGRARGVMYARLDAQSRMVRFVVEGWNLCGDHRLRVLFPLPPGCAAEEVVADMHYGPVSRHRSVDAGGPSSMEQPTATAPMHRYVSVADGLTVFGRGTYEYEITPEGAVAVTLLRAVGELSRDDLAARPGHAAWPAAIPAAQELGPFRVELAVAPVGIGSGASRDELLMVEALAEEFHAPLGGLMLNWATDPQRRIVGPRLDGAGLVFTAAKPGEAGRDVVFRCVNVTDQPVHGAWVFDRPIAAARLVALDESMIAPLVLIEAGRRVEFLAPPRAVVSVQVEPLLNRPS
jgi:alpha-mannosidase